MKSKAVAINPHDGFDLLAVWEKDGRKWYLLQLARPQSAIALAGVAIPQSGRYANARLESK